MARPVKMKSGDRFGMLEVVERAPNKIVGQTRWLCRCDCGNTSVVYSTHLRSGSIKSCGCNRAEAQKAAVTKHGAVGTPEHNTWNLMNARCHSPTAPDFPRYGGRGITVCDSWRWPNGFTTFLSDMGRRPKGTTLDRIDNDGPYSPDNCRWANRSEQQNNRRVTRFVTFGGETKPLADWARERGITQNALWNRLYLYKWSTARALGFEG